MAKTNVDLKKLLSQMTLDEKIGQLIQLNANFFGKSEAEITGPTQKFGFDPEYIKNIGSALNFQGVEEMIAIQDRHMADDRNKIPLVFMMDVIHGYRTIYPIPLAMGASFDPELVAECSRMAAKEASAGGIQVTFTPMVDYVRDARWGRVMETCGEDPYLNGVMGAAQVKAFQGDDISDNDRVAACVKHFAAYGGAEAGRDYNTVEISERLLREYYFPAYKACIDAGVKMLMPSFNTLNGIPSIGNEWLMKDVLRGEWKYDGIVISDYNAIGELVIHGIAANAKQAANMAFDCGCHMDMMSKSYYSSLKALVEEGTIPEAEVDKAVMRMLEFKKELGLFDDPYHGASVERSREVTLTAENRAIARKAAEQCAVLLKNDGILPISENVGKVALVGPFATTNELKGFWSCDGRDEETVSVYEGVKAIIGEDRIITATGCSARHDELSREGFDEAVKAAAEADVVVLCLGEPQNYSGEGNSRADIGLPGVQMELVREVLKVNSNVAALVFNGRPLTLTELDATVPAILDMWFPGSEGGNAAANLLFGRANPSGKVTMTFPKAVGQCPIYYNRPRTARPKRTAEDVHQPYASNYIGCGNNPLYPFGYGLSYSNFVYESLELDADTMTADGEINVKITVRNDSDVAGKEVVQLYMYDTVASTVRPTQSLIAFEKIELGAGERKTVTFKVTEPMLRFYDFKCNFISEPGEFTLSTGYADNLILTKSFRLV